MDNDQQRDSAEEAYWQEELAREYEDEREAERIEKSAKRVPEFCDREWCPCPPIGCLFDS